jgi:hypothetical protein
MPVSAPVSSPLRRSVCAGVQAIMNAAAAAGIINERMDCLLE